MYSESDLEAAQSLETLQSLVEELLRSNHDVSRRLRRIEDNIESRSVLTTCFRNGTIGGLATSDLASQDDVEAHELNLMKHRKMGSYSASRGLTDDVSPTGFHVELGTSRVYQRTELYESDVSFRSSVVWTHAWSVVSGLSLSEVSMIAVIALPLYLDEISNKEHYVTGSFSCTGANTTNQVSTGRNLLNFAAISHPT